MIRIRCASLPHLRGLATGSYLYAILTAYGNPAVPLKVKELGSERAVSLFVGQAEKEYWAMVPYLILVDPAVLLIACSECVGSCVAIASRICE